ncbi:MAG: hypothetical protein JWN07_3260 [Hyphomicrobiales bacterium]|nr:hypothetical protein [Hyphomicrobiales bacterium]
MATPTQEQISAPSSDLTALPARVAALRLKILEAVEDGDIERLRTPVEWNEVPPLFERGLKKGPGFDPLDALKARSFDGRGVEALAILKAVMEQPYVRIRRGPFQSYGWPAFAFAPPKAPDAPMRLAMLSCLRFADLGATPPPFHRVRIGADGTWHTFLPEP